MADITKYSAVRDGVRGNFTLNKMHTTTGDFFRIDVVHMLPCVPKDIISLNVHTYIEAAPNPFPINGSMKYGLYGFFVPYRLLWSEWKNYMTDLANVTQPYFTLEDLFDAFHSEDNPWAANYFDDALSYISNIRNLSAICHFLQLVNKSDIPASWLNRRFNGYALRAINLIWWDWFRDKAHISDAAKGSYVLDTGGHMTVAELIQLCAPKYRCFPKNYITTAFNAPQEGSASVQPVRIADPVRNPALAIPNTASSAGNIISTLQVGSSSGSTANPRPSNDYVKAQGSSGLNANIGQFDVSDLKLSNSIQNYRERLLVAGKTVLSRMLALFGTAPTVEELQMSNYLGGHEEDFLFKNALAPNTGQNGNSQGLTDSTPFGMNPLARTISGQKAMNASSPDNGFGLENITYKTDETGFLVVMGCITPVVQYFQALPRDWFRGTSTFAKDRSDYFHSDFENQPLQVMENCEVLCSEDVDPDGVYGFNQNYIDYKLEFDTIAGNFVNIKSSPLMQNMHLGRDLQDVIDQSGAAQKADALNPEYLTQSDQVDRMIFDNKFTLANPGDYLMDHFILNHKIECLANRPMMEITLPSLDSAISQSAKVKKVDTGGFRI